MRSVHHHYDGSCAIYCHSVFARNVKKWVIKNIISEVGVKMETRWYLPVESAGFRHQHAVCWSHTWVFSSPTGTLHRLPSSPSKTTRSRLGITTHCSSATDYVNKIRYTIEHPKIFAEFRTVYRHLMTTFSPLETH